MSKRRVYDVKGEGWTLHERGAKRSVADFDTKDAAVERAREVGRNNPEPSQVVIHKKDGTVQTEHTYRDDPYPPKG